MKKLAILLILLSTTTFAQQGAKRVRADTLVSFTPAGNIVVNDTLEILKYILFDSTSAPISVPARGLYVGTFTQQGFQVLHEYDSQGNSIEITRDNLYVVRNTSGSPISRGKVVYVTGSTGTVPTVSLAKADAFSTMQNIAVMYDSAANNNYARVMFLGNLEHIDMSAFSTGATLYISPTTAGELTATQPSYPNIPQIVGHVLNNGVGNGVFHVATRAAGGVSAISDGQTLTVNSPLQYVSGSGTGLVLKPVTMGVDTAILATKTDILNNKVVKIVLESDGNPSIANVDSLQFNSTNFALTNPSGNRVAVNTIQDIATTSSPTFANVNTSGYVGTGDNQVDFSGGNITFNGFNSGADIYFSGMPAIADNSFLVVGSSGLIQSVPDVAIGQVLTSQGTTSSPLWATNVPLIASQPNLSITSSVTNLNTSSLAQQQDTSASYFSFTSLGKPLFNMKGITGNSIVSVDSTGRVALSGTLNVGGSGTDYRLRVDGTSFMNGLSTFQNDSNLTISKWLAQNGNGIASFYADTNGSNYSQLNLFTPKDSGRTGVSFWFRHSDSATNLSYRAATIQAHDLKNSDDSTHKHFSIYVRAGTDSTNHAVDWYHSDQWDNQMKIRSSVGIKDSLGIKLGSGNNDVHSSKAFSIGDGGTDVYSMETASDRLRFYNDASPPVEIMSVDSAATLYGTLGNFGGGAVQIGGTTASIIIDGADGSEVAGTNKIYENAHLSISSRNGIFAKIDNDNNSTSQLFGVTTNGSATTVWEVGEGGLISKYGTIATVDNGVPAIYAKADSTAQAAAIGTTTLYAVPAAGAGQYRIEWNAKVTTAATSSSTLGALTIVYTDPDNVAQTITCGAQTNAGAIATTSTGNSTTTVLLGVPMLLNCKASTNITYAFAYTSSGGTAMQYNFHIKLEKL